MSGIGGMHPEDIAYSLRDLADEMVTIGAWMDYYGGFDANMVAHGRELVGAGKIARSWADEILAKVGAGGTASE